ncbi:hypothetical protein IY145_23575 [Methylosinus sp. H3A]|uniref:hypothetical protein n=1 Tax=Methylosinus sp. H3A TaxID=2785786 RepID=UPI0018C23AE0|nr:hypothetical protein [Methylosinus sp. H3A]MBG0812330.1 hypothetical protein [Methylosinus sp. H3A]
MTKSGEFVEQDDLAGELALAFARLPENDRRRCRHVPSGDRTADILVHVEAEDGSQWLEGVVVDAQRDDVGAMCLDEEFVVFSVTAEASGELIRCNASACRVELL